MSQTAASGANLVVEGLTKSFDGIRVVDDVSLIVNFGEIHGLLGHNGSGKSTLIKMLSGVYAPDNGRVTLGGRELPLPLPPGEFNRYGIAVVHQALGLVSSLSVTENLLARRLVRQSNPMIHWGKAHREARATLSNFGLAIDPRLPVSALTPVERALLAIIRAFTEISETTGDRGGLLILDEPTPFLPRVDVERLFELVRNLAGRGTSVIFVSHDVDEVKELTDQATVLRNGSIAASLTTVQSTKADFIAAIVGRHLDSERPTPGKLQRSKIMTISELTCDGLAPFDLEIGSGEVVGLTGLVGSGYDLVPYCIYGAKAAAGGRIILADKIATLTGMTPAEAIRRRMVLVPADRQGAGIAESLTVAENIALPAFGRSLPRFFVQAAKVAHHVNQLVEDFDIRLRDSSRPIRELSGGNQQKVVLAKWLQTEPDVILLDEPTQGVDVGARHQVYGFIRNAAERGAAVICASSDHEQLEMICDRVLVFSRGRVVASLTGADVNKVTITQYCLDSVAGTLATPPATLEEYSQ
ncbi:ATP-binding cassette domain-containing protein [Rhizobium lusitanum]|uniref:Autoinducer 2 import ATP-binding protein LsrA n=1 Tax=Rhizobium lusitanum TaxID=293958 RepID=A0A6L9UGN1_9HYPH|nr:sugar ABC transporter ATP-binding protein [Rhizobium lusitanum]NEI74481.1 ATP-binding cassette domain-containing protein [Rhizobium lusitanum]